MIKIGAIGIACIIIIICSRVPKILIPLLTIVSIIFIDLLPSSLSVPILFGMITSSGITLIYFIAEIINSLKK